MKHITTLIALALTLGTLVPLAAQTKMTAKEKRTQTRQERKIAQQKVKFSNEADRQVSVLSKTSFPWQTKKPRYKSVLTPLVHFKTGWEVLL